MLSLKLFIEAVHDAIIKANRTLYDNSEMFLLKFFSQDPGDATKLLPKTVTFDFPDLTASGKVVNVDVKVPLITLVPITNTQIEKATFTFEFEVQEIDGELKLNFIKTGGFIHKKLKTKPSKVEIVITPQQSPEGIKLLVEEYERMIKKQLS
jgi:hypothetical protein